MDGVRLIKNLDRKLTKADYRSQKAKCIWMEEIDEVKRSDRKDK